MKTGVETETLRTATIFQQINPSLLLDRYQPTIPHTAASLAKLWISAAAFHLAEKGEIDLREPLSIDWRQFREGNYGTGRLRWTPQAILMRVSHRIHSSFGEQLIPPQPLLSLLRRSVKDSDNLATLVIADALGRPNLQRVIDKWGMRDTIIYDPKTNGPATTTAADVARFLLDLKKDRLIQPQSRELFLSWLQKRTMLNRELQPNTILYKDGRYSQAGDTYLNRAGYVITCYGDPYLFVILTKDHPGYRGETSARQEDKVREFTEETARKII